MTNIKDLCDYYLHCILYDSLSIYLPLTNIGKDFIKLSDVPSDINAEIMTNEGYDYIRNAYFNSKNKKNLYIGYLTTVSNNKIIPLFLFPIIRKNGSFQCNLTEPIINTAFIKKITFLNGFQLALEIINLHGDLDTKNLHFNEVLKKIGQIRPNYSFNTEIIFLSTEISNFTKGLENELTELKTSIDYQNTSLKYLLNMNGGTNTKRTSILEDNIREFVPMNKEQFNSIYSSFNNDLTLIYGPPGTGKSQVVINILLNAIINNKKILFCSKNNKAIEVVKEKMKKITQGNVLLDLGDITSTANFFHQILTFNGAIPQNLSINGNEYKHCIDKIKEIEGEEEKIIKLRNEIDNFDKREISVYRGNFNDDIFLNLKKLDYNSSFEELEKIEDYIFKYNEDKNSFFLLKCFKIKKIFRLLKCRKNVFKIVKDIGYNGNIYKNLKIINDLLQQGERIKKYFNDLQKLSNEKSLYDLQKQKMNIDHRKNQIVSDYLYKFLRNRQSDLMKQRGNLANFITLLNFIIKGPTPQQRKDFCKNILNFNNFCYCITSLSSSHIPLEPNIFDLVVFDESSQCDIASAIPLLYRSKRAVIIGDDKQLKHITSLSTQMDGKLLSDHKIDLPYSYTQNSLIDIFSTISNNKFYLKHHFRSHNDIIAFSSKQWYGGKLIVETKYEKLKLLDSEKSVEWYDVIGNVQNLQSGSIYNSKEVEEVFKIIEDLIYNKKYKGSIGVVSPFRPQVNKLEEYKVRDIELNNILNGMDFNIDTVNKFQGDEKDIIIFSVTINGGAKKGALDFLKYTSNLFNVAITRARAKLIIVGDSGYCRKCGIDYLEKFVEYCVNLGINTFKNNVFKNKFESEWEENLYKKLKENSIEVIPQYTIDKYRLDFALIDEGGRKLDIEVDGEYYHRDWDGELIKYDQARNQRLIELGWDVMRFWVFEIRDNMDMCIEKIKKWQKR